MSITKETKEKLIADLKEKATKENLEINEQALEKFEEICEIAKQPIKYKNEDFAMGEGELDIRELNSKNLKQVEFRQSILNNVYLKGISDTLIDLLRVLCVIGKKLGITDIEKEINDFMDEEQKKIN